MLLHSIQLKNFLSYGPDSQPLTLQNLNVIIGANGSGKSNFFEAIALLKSTPQELVRPIRLGGSVRDWIWKDGLNKEIPIASVEVVVDKGSKQHIYQNLRYRFDFTETAKRFDIVDERLEYEKAIKGNERPFFFYKYEHGNPVLNVKTKGKWDKRVLRKETIDPEKSILAQRYDPDTYQAVEKLTNKYTFKRVSCIV